MLKVFMNTWGNYNENGAEGGKWITLPMDEDELQETLDEIAEAMGDRDPEWAIHDYEWEGDIDFGDVNEMDNVFKWNEICEEADDLDGWELKEVAAAIEAFGYSFAEAVDRQQRGCFTFYPGQNLVDVAYEIVEDCYFSEDVPEVFKNYFDYEAYARDLGFDGYRETDYGVICDC